MVYAATRSKNAPRSSRVVDRAEDGRRRDGLGRLVVVEVAELDRRAARRAGAPPRRPSPASSRRRGSGARARADARRSRRRRRRGRAPRRPARGAARASTTSSRPVREVAPRVGVLRARSSPPPGARTGPPCRSQRQQALGVLADEAGHPAQRARACAARGSVRSITAAYVVRRRPRPGRTTAPSPPRIGAVAEVDVLAVVAEARRPSRRSRRASSGA